MKKAIDIETLSYEELLDLNDRVVNRITYLDSIQTLDAMQQFTQGSKVSFDTQQGRQTGTLIKFNRKTVVVLTEDGRQWKLSPRWLSKVKDAQSTGVVVDITQAGKKSV